eukprot:5992568-Alexandrium_andersonii.AAC.1
MSASLVGSEMCIRDRRIPLQSRMCQQSLIDQTSPGKQAHTTWALSGSQAANLKACRLQSAIRQSAIRAALCCWSAPGLGATKGW